ncbi:MAG: hypothetical protein K8S56_09995 [Candidatus Cloacimonetes bacterium]|nr:hypothetical protein [Candidatus Cloacimonadota bacterium]
MKKWILTAIILSLFLTLSGFRLFDGQRKGFVVGLGLGPSYTSWHKTEKDLENDTRTSQTDDRFGLGISLMLGYAPTNKLIFHNFTQGATFCDYQEKDKEKQVSYSHALGGFGATYYFRPGQEDTHWEPSIYFSTGIGYANWLETIKEKKELDIFGSGVYFGLGYEFKKHMRIEASLLLSNPADKTSQVDEKVDTFSILLTLFGVAY